MLACQYLTLASSPWICQDILPLRLQETESILLLDSAVILMLTDPVTILVQTIDHEEIILVYKNQLKQTLT